MRSSSLPKDLIHLRVSPSSPISQVCIRGGNVRKFRPPSDQYTALSLDCTPVCADEVETTAACLATEQEEELVAAGVVELVHQLLPLADAAAETAPMGSDNRLSAVEDAAFKVYSATCECYPCPRGRTHTHLSEPSRRMKGYLRAAAICSKRSRVWV